MSMLARRAGALPEPRSWGRSLPPERPRKGYVVNSFHPPRRILMGPGPSDVSPRVLAALSRPTIGHLDPAFQGLMEEIKAALARLMNAPDHACVPLPAPGTAGMEAAIMNLLEPGDTAVVAVNGGFGEPMVDMA